MTMSVNAIHDFTGRGETRSATLRIAPQADEALAGVWGALNYIPRAGGRVKSLREIRKRST